MTRNVFSGYRRRFWLRAADASDYISYLPDLIQESGVREVILYCRVSGRNQWYGGNLDNQVVNLCREVILGHNLRVRGVYSAIASGWKRDDNVWLEAAFEHARELGAAVVAESVDRLRRHLDYNDHKNKNLWPTDDDFEHLLGVACGVPVATVVYPTCRRITCGGISSGAAAHPNSEQ